MAESAESSKEVKNDEDDDQSFRSDDLLFRAITSLLEAFTGKESSVFDRYTPAVNSNKKKTSRIITQTGVSARSLK